MSKNKFFNSLKDEATKKSLRNNRYKEYSESEEYYDEEYYDEDYDESEEEYYEDEEYDESEEEYYEDEEYDESEEEYYEDEEYDESEEEYYEDEEYDESEEEYYEDEAYDESEEYYEDDQVYADASEGYYEDGDYAEDSFDYYEDEDDYSGMSFKERVLTKLHNWYSEMTAMDVVVGLTGVVVMVAAIIVLSTFVGNKHLDKQIEALAPVGNQILKIGVVGESGLLAMSDSALTAQQALATQQIEAEGVKEDDNKAEEKEKTIKVNVSFESVERDLKIRFINSETGALITGTAFEVNLTNAKGKVLTLTDTDMDGMIYASNVNPGDFSAVITSTDKYKFPTAATKVTVRGKVQYIVVNVQDEVKNEAQVDVKKEDTEKVEAKQEEVTITDTVEFVASSKTLVAGTDSFYKIDKGNIADPDTVASIANKRMLLDALKVELNKKEAKLYIGNSETLTGTEYKDSEEDNSEGGKNKYTYTWEWKSSNPDIVTVDNNGKITAKAVGTADITYTVTQKTVTTKEVSTEVETETEIETEVAASSSKDEEMTEEVTTEEKNISKDEYEGLSEKEQAKCSANTDEAGEIVNYTYKKEITKQVPKKSTKEEPKTVIEKIKKKITKKEKKTETSESTQSQSATCKVTVENVKITAGTLEIKAAADTCNVKSTVEIKPTKIEYTKNDGTKETITDKFPELEWSSSDTNIATVDKTKGIVTGVKAGDVTITGRLKGINGADGKELDIKASVKLSIKDVKTLTIKLNKEEYSVGVNKTVNATATVTNYAKDASVTWSSENTNIATVNEKGVIKGVSVGSVKITATTIEKDATTGKPVSITCVVKVSSSAAADTKTKLKDKSGRQVYVKNKEGKYVEAVYADYYTSVEFFLQGEAKYTYTGWQTINGKTYFYNKEGKPVTGAQVIQGVTYNFGSDGAIVTNLNGSVFGIDVSKHNGKIDWNAVKASGVDFAIIRCAYRGSSTGALIEDSNFHTNIKGATAAGIKVGIYLFSQAVNEVEAVKEASLAVSLAKGYNLTYPIFIDTEASGGRADALDTATRTAVVNAFCQTVQNSGYRAGIYASKTWYEKKLDMSVLNNYRLWLAQYAPTPTYAGRYDMWQYSSKGTISGISTKVDLNWSYMGY